jgi:D-beta-D-heptose 7-phosphate kinase/D-beta-D-heptose 1-phosphate adenosyltransferase
MKKKIIEFKTADIIIKNLRKNKKVVFTNGCFDIIHIGHARYLKEAKDCGDILVVGLNSDESVKRLKGNSRPIISENDRAEMLSHLESVDFVIIFNEETPLNLIKKVKPDVLVKGGDWEIDQIVGSKFVLENGGKVKSLSFIDGISTSKIIEKIQNMR